MTDARLLEGRSAVVVGASRGIGLATARLLARSGARVAMVARSADELRARADELGAHAVAVDASTPAGVDSLREVAGQVFGGPPDLVVSAAGAFVLRPIVETGAEDFERVVAANLRGPFLVARAFLPAMLERRGGHIVNVGSIAGRIAMPGNGAYSASKFGLRGFHEVLAEEVRGTGVRVTMIEPAATDTPLWDPLDPDSRPDLPSRAQMLAPEDVARAILYAFTQPEGVEISLLAVRSSK